MITFVHVECGPYLVPLLLEYYVPWSADGAAAQRFCCEGAWNVELVKPSSVIILKAFLGLLHEVQLFSLGPFTITSVNSSVTLHQTVPCLIISYMNNGCNATTAYCLDRPDVFILMLMVSGGNQSRPLGPENWHIIQKFADFDARHQHLHPKQSVLTGNLFLFLLTLELQDRTICGPWIHIADIVSKTRITWKQW